MRYILVLLLTILVHSGFSQKQNEYARVDALAIQLPDSSSKSTLAIAKYIDGHFIQTNDKARAVFAWLAHNIQYDVANMYNVNFNLNTEEIILKTLKERKAICQGYAEVYHDIANKLGIKSYVIEGYTRKNDRMDYLPHAWIAVYLDSSWSLIDPTWGSGNIMDGKYNKLMNNYYFRAKPEKLISSHIAFDPLFQFLNYPVSNLEFSDGKTELNKLKPFFNYLDTLNVYEQMSDIPKLNASTRRIEANGVNNALVFDRLQYLRREVEYIQNKAVVGLYNSAVADFNLAVSLLNQFIGYRNQQFIPTKPDPEIKHMVDTVETLLNSTNFKLFSIQNPDKNNVDAIRSMTKNLESVKENLEEQKTFLAKYFSTSKVFRKSLFYSYKKKSR